MARKVGGVADRGWLWLDQRIVGEVDASSTGVQRFVHAEGGLGPAWMESAGRIYRILTDERGGVRWVFYKTDGSLAQALEYDEFGRADQAPGRLLTGEGGQPTARF